MATAGKPPDGPKSEGSNTELTPAERAEFQRRSDDIGRRVEAAKGTSRTLPKPQASRVEGGGSALGDAMRVSTELLGGILVGSGIGYLLDWALGTGPALFIVFFLLGAAAGMLAVIRSSAPKTSAGKQPAVSPAPTRVQDEGDDDEDDRR